MPEGTCDPASRGQTWNIGRMEVDNGTVLLEYEYGWDGSSVKPNCVGPINRVRVTNNSATVTYYAHFQGRRGQWRRIVLSPAEVNVYGTTALNNAGFVDNTDLEGLYITTDPNPPTATLKRG